MLYLTMGIACILFYQMSLLRRQSASPKERRLALSVTGVAFVFGTISIFWPEWVNPSQAIRLLFEPIQNFIIQG
ncbi:hypothetical protein PAECIP111891_02834 [Paenibacillus allorhizoplanae]|uniref:Uncharacterized protein n=1 Tax=Paenibacillus allorhizoplanae TaxID=2905648 RepID=A0ABN8GFN4_9BACL|nr:hypothetical protein [Paenibacillus allorhizoplanae]CAH1206220.1 hypothetical protein PAECIP111891_02834 [Paenibacillus allorhizoplanae]